MSASLVGSEMCIRDRSSVDSKPQQARRATRPCPALWITGSTRANLPVSYTHLTLPTICSV
eukprot:8351212-Alexandrium_andersonii.AAC.1